MRRGGIVLGVVLATLAATIGQAGMSIAGQRTWKGPDRVPPAQTVRWGAGSPRTASADPAKVLFYGPTSGGLAASTPNIQATVWDAPTWAAATTFDFYQFDAIVFGDEPICFEDPSIWTTAIQNQFVWGLAVTGNIIINGTDPDYHGKDLLVHQSVQFAAADAAPGPGLYVSLSCAYHTSSAAVADLLSMFGTFNVRGVINCPNDAHKVADHPTLAGIGDFYLSGWSCSTHEVFDTWPGNFTPLAIIRDATPAPGGTLYTAPDGTTGYVYMLATGATVQCDTSQDPDGDCLPNGAETTIGTDPNNPDTDGDGLKDSWEAPPNVAGAGVHLTSGRVIARDTVFGPYGSGACAEPGSDRRLPSPYPCYNHAPDPLHKDVFLEIDWQDCTVGFVCPEVISEHDDPLHHAPHPDGLGDIVAQFATAPVQNPDNIGGVRLNILVDEAIPHTPNCDQDGSIGRSTNFGSPQQRLDPAIIEAKQMAVRYVWSGHSSARADGSECPNPGRLEFLAQGLGQDLPGVSSALAFYDHTPFGDANVGGRDILFTLGILWSCSSQIGDARLGFVGPCFREGIQSNSGFGSSFTLDPGIFPAKVNTGSGEEARNYPINRLLGEKEHDGIRQLWARGLMHLLGHSLGLSSDLDVRNKPAPAGRHQAAHDAPLTPLAPESYTTWSGLSYAPTGDGTPTSEAYPNYDELARTDTTLSDPDSDGVLEHDDNCPGVWNPDQDDLDFGFLGFGVNSIGVGDACDPDIDGDGERNPLPGTSSASIRRSSPLQLAAAASDPYPYDTNNDGQDNVVDDDDDGDLVLDASDNCKLIANPGQQDLDGDGAGNVCDVDADGDGLLNEAETAVGSSPASASSKPEYVGFGATCSNGADDDGDGQVDGADSGCVDSDGDTAPDVDDNCPSVANPGWMDTDSNGVGDACQRHVDIEWLSTDHVNASDQEADLLWSGSDAGTFSVRVGGSNCSTGSVVASGSYDPFNPRDPSRNATVQTPVYATDLQEGSNQVRVCLTVAPETVSDAVTITKETSPPPPPTNVAATASDRNGSGAADDVTVTWNASTAPDVVRYTVERDGGVLGTVDAGQTLRLIDLDVPLGTHAYQVRAEDGAGNLSGPSAPATITVTDTLAPAAPTGVTATCATPSPAAHVAWQANTDRDLATYRVFRQRIAHPGPRGKIVQVAETPATSTTDDTVHANPVYEYRVRAVDGAGNASQPSAPAVIDMATCP